MEGALATDGLAKSRQKNCRGCVQAKRRCDRRAPACSRCVERKVDCIYGKTHQARGPVVEGLSEPPSLGLLVDNELAFGSGAWSPFATGPSDPDLFTSTFMEPHLSLASPVTEPTRRHESTNAMVVDDISVDAFFPNLLGNNTITPAEDQWLVQAEPERPASPADEEVVSAYERMADTDTCKQIEPWHLYDEKQILHHIITRVKAFTTDIATRNAAPFLHRHLYRDQTPPCILACFATSTLYANRTEVNKAMVMKALDSSVKELVDTEARCVVATPLDRLARVHALFLYQIIRLLDGDVMLRAQGERDIPLLQAWLHDLGRVRDNLGDTGRLGDPAIGKPPPKEWEAWIFAESVRRTILIAFSFLSLYRRMTNTEDDSEHHSNWVHRWTLSRHLWEADSAFQFTRIWKETPQFVIKNFSFDHFLEYGTCDDVDEFAEIILSAYMGVDAVQEFMSARVPNTKGGTQSLMAPMTAPM